METKEIVFTSGETALKAVISIGKEQSVCDIYIDENCESSTMIDTKDVKMYIFKKFLEYISTNIEYELTKFIL